MASRRLRVLIVGAGAAGLSAARTIVDDPETDIEVVLLEARDRPGGRVLTQTLPEVAVPARQEAVPAPAPVRRARPRKSAAAPAAAPVLRKSTSNARAGRTRTLRRGRTRARGTRDHEDEAFARQNQVAASPEGDEDVAEPFCTDVLPEDEGSQHKSLTSDGGKVVGNPKAVGTLPRRAVEGYAPPGTSMLPAIRVDVGASVMHGCADANQSVFRRAVEEGIRAPPVAGGAYYECTEHARWFDNETGDPIPTRTIAEMHALSWLIGRCLAVMARASDEPGGDLLAHYNVAKAYVLENMTARRKPLTRIEECVLEKIRIRAFAYCSPMSDMALVQAAVHNDVEDDPVFGDDVYLNEDLAQVPADTGLLPKNVARATTLLQRRVDRADHPPLSIASRRPQLMPDRIVLDGYTPFLIDKLKVGLDIRYNTVVSEIHYDGLDVAQEEDRERRSAASRGRASKTPARAKPVQSSELEISVLRAPLSTPGASHSQQDFEGDQARDVRAPAKRHQKGSAGGKRTGLSVGREEKLCQGSGLRAENEKGPAVSSSRKKTKIFSSTAEGKSKTSKGESFLASGDAKTSASRPPRRQMTRSAIGRQDTRVRQIESDTTCEETVNGASGDVHALGKHRRVAPEALSSSIAKARKFLKEPWEVTNDDDRHAVRVKTKCGKTFFADWVIVTLPIGVLQGLDARSAVTFSPPLSEDKQDAINTLGMGVHNKIVLRFHPNDVFWPDASPQINCLDPRFQFLNLHAYGKPGVLLAHVFGGTTFSKGYHGLDDEAVIQEVLSVLQGMFYGVRHVEDGGKGKDGHTSASSHPEDDSTKNMGSELLVDRSPPTAGNPRDDSKDVNRSRLRSESPGAAQEYDEESSESGDLAENGEEINYSGDCESGPRGSGLGTQCLPPAEQHPLHKSTGRYADDVEEVLESEGDAASLDHENAGRSLVRASEIGDVDTGAKSRGYERTALDKEDSFEALGHVQEAPSELHGPSSPDNSSAQSSGLEDEQYGNEYEVPQGISLPAEESETQDQLGNTGNEPTQSLEIENMGTHGRRLAHQYRQREGSGGQDSRNDRTRGLSVPNGWNSLETLPTPLDVVVTRWDSDPYSLGSYSFLPRGADWSMIEEMARPEPKQVRLPTLFFAGEHCDDLGWQCVHGACESGSRAAKRIMQQHKRYVSRSRLKPVQRTTEDSAHAFATGSQYSPENSRERDLVRGNQGKSIFDDGGGSRACRHCGKRIDGSYGSGRFCSLACSRARFGHVPLRPESDSERHESAEGNVPRSSAPKPQKPAPREQGAQIVSCENCRKHCALTLEGGRFCSPICQGARSGPKGQRDRSLDALASSPRTTTTKALPHVPAASCERCGKLHDGTYGSGRFCSLSCCKSRPGPRSRQTTQAGPQLSATAGADARGVDEGKPKICEQCGTREKGERQNGRCPSCSAGSDPATRQNEKTESLFARHMRTDARDCHRRSSNQSSKEPSGRVCSALSGEDRPAHIGIAECLSADQGNAAPVEDAHGNVLKKARRPGCSACGKAQSPVRSNGLACACPNGTSTHMRVRSKGAALAESPSSKPPQMGPNSLQLAELTSDIVGVGMAEKGSAGDSHETSTTCGDSRQDPAGAHARSASHCGEGLPQSSANPDRAVDANASIFKGLYSTVVEDQWRPGVSRRRRRLTPKAEALLSDSQSGAPLHKMRRVEHGTKLRLYLRDPDST